MYHVTRSATLVLLLLQRCASLEAWEPCPEDELSTAANEMTTACEGATDYSCSAACRTKLATLHMYLFHDPISGCQPTEEMQAVFQKKACGYYWLVRLFGAPTDGTDDEAWAELKDVFSMHYAFFNKRSIDWPARWSELEADTSLTPVERMKKAAMVFQGTGADETGDGHVSVAGSPSGTVWGGLGPAWLGKDNENLAKFSKIAKTEASASFVNKVMDVGISKKIIYMNIHVMQELTDGGMAADGARYAEELNKIFNASDAQGAKGVVLDLRFNEGGYDYVSMNIIGFFTESVTRVLSKKAKVPGEDAYTPEMTMSSIVSGRTVNPFLGPMVVLQSRYTMSAAESCTMGFHARTPTPTFVGEPTNGCYSDMMTAPLANGMAITLSNQYYMDLQGVNHEAEGTPLTEGSENNIPMDTAQIADASDPQLARAFAVLESSTYSYSSSTLESSTSSPSDAAYVSLAQGLSLASILFTAFLCFVFLA